MFFPHRRKTQSHLLPAVISAITYPPISGKRMSGLIKLHHSGNPAHLSTNLFERPHMGRQIQFVLSRGKMSFKYVESKVISYVSDRDPEQTPWEKNYPENCKQSGCQRTGNLCCNLSTAHPHGTPSCPELGHGVLCLRQSPRSQGLACTSSLRDTSCLPPRDLQPHHLPAGLGDHSMENSGLP